MARTSEAADASSFTQSNILEALQLIHSPGATNDHRRAASSYLDGLKADNEHALQYGFTFSTDSSQPPQVQHFGLSLLSHVVRHGLHNLSEAQNVELRNCVLDLGRSVKAGQLAFVRNKIAELWIELAKRSWALDWFDMDEQLVRLWSGELVHKDFVLTVLENLSEDIFAREDSIAVLRGKDLNSALVEIFTPSSNFPGGIKIGGSVHHMRFGDEGWLTRIAAFTSESADNSMVDGQLKEVILKALATLRSVFIWVMTPAMSHSRAFEATCNFLTSSDPDLIIPALDTLLSSSFRSYIRRASKPSPNSISGLSFPQTRWIARNTWSPKSSPSCCPCSPTTYARIQISQRRVSTWHLSCSS
jgi:exportin-5